MCIRDRQSLCPRHHQYSAGAATGFYLLSADAALNGHSADERRQLDQRDAGRRGGIATGGIRKSGLAQMAEYSDETQIGLKPNRAG